MISDRKLPVAKLFAGAAFVAGCVWGITNDVRTLVLVGGAASLLGCYELGQLRHGKQWPPRRAVDRLTGRGISRGARLLRMVAAGAGLSVAAAAGLGVGKLAKVIYDLSL